MSTQTRDLTLLMGQKNYDRISSYVKKDRSLDTINAAELGCVLSHLVAIRRAYSEGHTMAMIVEDDITHTHTHVAHVGLPFLFLGP
jgi:GR25 family glycosyltransferase involved in LPS biosynthesis